MAEAEEPVDLAAWVLSVAARVIGCEFAALYLPGKVALVLHGSRRRCDTPLETISRVEVGDGVWEELRAGGKS